MGGSVKNSILLVLVSLCFVQRVLTATIRFIDPVESEGSEHVEHAVTSGDKVLRKPVAFSYNEDLKSSASDTHHASGGGGGGGKHESGGGKLHHSEHHSADGEKGEKAYKGHHEHESAEKGHHDKEAHKGHYDDKGGKAEKHFHEDGYDGHHAKGAAAQKEGKFGEEGKHSKGHSTKGGHSVSKKDHFEKKHEFFDEFYEGGDSEKEGGFHHENDFHKGGSQKGGHKGAVGYEAHFAQGKHFEQGKHYDEDKGHSEAAGKDEHQAHNSKYGEEGGKSGAKKWGYKKSGDHGSANKIQEEIKDIDDDVSPKESGALDTLESIVQNMVSHPSTRQDQEEGSKPLPTIAFVVRSHAPEETRTRYEKFEKSKVSSLADDLIGETNNNQEIIGEQSKDNPDIEDDSDKELVVDEYVFRTTTNNKNKNQKQPVQKRSSKIDSPLTSEDSIKT